MSRGRPCIGSFMLSEKKLLPSAVKRRGAVSPIAREIARSIPVKMPDKAVGTKVEKNDRQRLGPGGHLGDGSRGSGAASPQS